MVWHRHQLCSNRAVVPVQLQVAQVGASSELLLLLLSSSSSLQSSGGQSLVITTAIAVDANVESVAKSTHIKATYSRCNSV